MVLGVFFELLSDTGYEDLGISKILSKEYHELIPQDYCIWAIFYSVTNLRLLSLSADTSLEKWGFKRGSAKIHSLGHFEMIIILVQKLETI